jgi:hypothetical protein
MRSVSTTSNPNPTIMREYAVAPNRRASGAGWHVCGQASQSVSVSQQAAPEEGV